MVDLLVLHIDSLRQTFDQTLIKSFDGFRRYGSDKKVLRKDKRMDRRTDRRTDAQTKAISIIPHPICGGGLKSDL